MGEKGINQALNWQTLWKLQERDHYWIIISFINHLFIHLQLNKLRKQPWEDMRMKLLWMKDLSPSC